MCRHDAPVTLSNPVTADELEALVAGVTLEEIDLAGAVDSPPFRFLGSPLTWRARLHAHYDGAMRVRPELLRQYSDGSLVWGGVEEAATFDTPGEALLAALDAASGCERLLCDREDLRRHWDELPRPLAFATEGATCDLDSHFGRRWRLAEEGHVVPPAADQPLALATDEGDVLALLMRRGRYRTGGLALELTHEDGSHHAMLTYDAGLSRATDPFVCLDIEALGPGIATWVERLGIGSATGQDLRCDVGLRLPIFEMSAAYVVALPPIETDPGRTGPFGRAGGGR